MVLLLFVFLKHSALQTGYQGGGHESRLPANEGMSLRYALCALRNVKVTMPAIASLEDLKAAQEEGASIYAMRHALCSMHYGNGAG